MQPEFGGTIRKIILVLIILILFTACTANNGDNNNLNTENKYVGLIGKDKDFIIVSSANYDENFHHLSTDFYYINKKSPEKLFLFSSGSYRDHRKYGVN
ncbi:MAG: hypothetical protein AB7V48_02715 [Sedimentibacter sp.]